MLSRVHHRLVIALDHTNCWWTIDLFIIRCLIRCRKQGDSDATTDELRWIGSVRKPNHGLSSCLGQRVQQPHSNRLLRLCPRLQQSWYITLFISSTHHSKFYSYNTTIQFLNHQIMKLQSDTTTSKRRPRCPFTCRGARLIRPIKRWFRTKWHDWTLAVRWT